MNIPIMKRGDETGTRVCSRETAGIASSKEFRSTASAVLLTVMLITACGSYIPPRNHFVLDSRIIEQPRDSVWKRALEYFRVLDIPEKDIDSDAGRIRTWTGVSTWEGKEQFDCGVVNGDTVDQMVYSIHHDLSIQPMNENRTLLILKCRIYAILDTVDNGGVWMGTFTHDIRNLPCMSRGKWESQLMDIFEGNRRPLCGSSEE